MRDMLFSMPPGPMPAGEKVKTPPKPEIPEWQPVKDKPHLEINRRGQLRTNIPVRFACAMDDAMLQADSPSRASTAPAALDWDAITFASTAPAGCRLVILEDGSTGSTGWAPFNR